MAASIAASFAPEGSTTKRDDRNSLSSVRLVGLLAALAAIAASCARAPVPLPVPSRPPALPTPEAKPRILDFEATAYSIEGTTADGSQSREGIVAADPDVLPLGSRIRVHGAGSYSGEYVVADTGRAIRGREIDIYMSKNSEARRFGRRDVRVEVLDYGEGR